MEKKTGSSKKYRILPSLMTGKLGENFYVYDGNSTVSPIVCIPTQKVPKRAYDVIRKLKETNPNFEPWSAAEIKALFHTPKDASAIDVLIRQGYLEEYTSHPISSQGAWKNNFQNTEAKHYFNNARFF